MGQTLTTLAPLLKEVYETGLTEQLNNDTKAYNRIKSNSKASAKWGGKYVNFPIHVARNSGIGSRNENEALPTAGYQDTREAMIPMKYHYAAVELTGQAIELADKDYQTFAATLDLEVSSIKKDVSKERNRMFFGNGSGARGVSAGGPTGQTLTLSDARQIDLNGVYDIMIGSTAVVRQTAVVVTNIDYVTKVVTFTGTLTGTIAGDILVRTGSYGREWTGLGAILSDTTVLHQIDPATVPVWKAEMKTGAGAISELMMIRMADRIYTNGGKTSVIWTTLGVQRAYFSLLQSQKRFVNTTKFEGGFSGVAFQSASQGDIPMIPDIDAPAGTAAYVDEKSITLYNAEGYKFMDRSGSMWQQKRTAAGKFDVWEATLKEYSEMGTNRRNTHGMITGITEDVFS
jgi:hypothetical protein